MKKSFQQIMYTVIMAVAWGGIVNADTLAVWSFDTGGTSTERLAASNTVSGAVASGLTMNTDAGGYGFDDVGINAVPGSAHDGYGFGGAAGEQVMFTHRANYFDTSAVPSPRPTVNDFTSFGSGDSGSVSQGTSAGLGDGNAPISFTVAAFIGQTVTISNLTVACVTGNPGAPLIVQFQEAGEAAGSDVTLNAGVGWTNTASLTTPVVIESGQTKTFTINLNSGALNSVHNIDSIELDGAVATTGAGAVALAEWNFNTGSSSSNRLESSAVTNGAVVSSLTMNTDAGGFGFDVVGVNAVPSSVHDGYGFGGNSGEDVMFLHRATYFDASAVPDPRPTPDDYTSFGSPIGGGGQGSTAGLGNGNAPVYFTVTAETGKVIIVESITCHKVSGDAFIMNIQQAGGIGGTTVTLPPGNQTETMVLNAPLVIENGETKTFTMNWNSGVLNSSHNLNEFVLNGAVTDAVLPSPTAAVLSIMSSGGNVSVTASNMHVEVQNQLQGRDSLSLGGWNDLGSPTTGVSQASWVIPASNAASFYQVESFN